MTKIRKYSLEVEQLALENWCLRQTNPFLDWEIWHIFRGLIGSSTSTFLKLDTWTSIWCVNPDSFWIFYEFYRSSSWETWFFRGREPRTTLQRTNISHLMGKGKSSSKCHFLGDMLVPWKVFSLKFPSKKNSTKTCFFWRFENFDLRISYPDCERCPRGFATVFAASLTLFSQIVAGDQWSSISVPLAEARFLHDDMAEIGGDFLCRFCWLGWFQESYNTYQKIANTLRQSP